MALTVRLGVDIHAVPLSQAGRGVPSSSTRIGNQKCPLRVFRLGVVLPNGLTVRADAGRSGIYLPRLAATVPAKAAGELLGNNDIRTRTGWRSGSCRNGATGPLDDRQVHYLYARAHQVAAMLATPAPWRGAMEVDRLTQAIQLRERVNKHYLTDSIHELKTRTTA
jgi:hypothetical protein